MAHDDNFSNIDIKLTLDFLSTIKNRCCGEKALDLCGGISRCSEILCPLFDMIDVCDLQPSFGDMPQEKRGELIVSNLKDIKYYMEYGEYDVIFGNWALCYIGYQDMVNVIVALYMGLKKNGCLIIKEPILNDDKITPRMCSTGQLLITRPL